MANIFKKLNLKDQNEILIVNSPESFEAEIEQLANVKVLRELGKAKEIHFSLTFVTSRSELNKLVPKLVKKIIGDAVVWFAYPKKTSKTFTSDINRDAGWEVLGEAGFEGVRQVAIDQDWSALRFRHVDYIKEIKRSPDFALSKEGKKRAKGDC